jgi:hypothetical protein
LAPGGKQSAPAGTAQAADNPALDRGGRGRDHLFDHLLDLDALIINGAVANPRSRP